MTILVAEDDEAIFDVIKIILDGEGHTVVHAVDEASVLPAVLKKKPQLILLDISLGGGDGGEITKILKQNPQTKHIPIIMMSANTETEAIAKRSGADGFLLKPFDIEALLSMIKDFSK